MKKRLLMIMVALLAIFVVGCGTGDADYVDDEYYEEDYDEEYYDDEDYDEDYDEEDFDDEEYYGGDTNEEALDSYIRSEEGLKEVSELFEKYELGKYVPLTGGDWFDLDLAEQDGVLESFYAFAQELGIETVDDEKAIKESLAFHLDKESPSEESLYGIFMNLVLTKYEKIQAFMFYDINNYQKLLAEGVVAKIPQEIIEITNSFAVNKYVNTPNITLGHDEISVQLTEADKNEPEIMQMGSLTAPNEEFIDQVYEAQNGIFEDFYVGDVDLLPILEEIGAITAAGKMEFKQLEVLHTIFDVEKIILLSKDEQDELSIAVLNFDKQAETYVWDEEVYYGTGYTCFTTEGDFCYMDEEGSLNYL
ncbi:MAG TPA: hypothetical protein H9887_08285 [Candidatus Dorea intestinavium]|nr:hypothetical protein [Candidatus Dorea intestinavium]